MNQFIFFALMVSSTYLGAQNDRQDGIGYRPVGIAFTDSLTQKLASPTPPPAWHIEYPNGFGSDILITIPNTDDTNMKSHFLYRNGRFMRLTIKKIK